MRPWSYALPLEGKLNGEKKIRLEFLHKRSSDGVVLCMAVKNHGPSFKSHFGW